MNQNVLSLQKARKLSIIIGILSKGLMNDLEVAPTYKDESFGAPIRIITAVD